MKVGCFFFGPRIKWPFKYILATYRGEITPLIIDFWAQLEWNIPIFKNGNTSPNGDLFSIKPWLPNGGLFSATILPPFNTFHHGGCWCSSPWKPCPWSPWHSHATASWHHWVTGFLRWSRQDTVGGNSRREGGAAMSVGCLEDGLPGLGCKFFKKAHGDCCISCCPFSGSGNVGSKYDVYLEDVLPWLVSGL